MKKNSVSLHIELETQESTFQFGYQIGRRLQDRDILCFSGDLGAGKTTMIKGIAKGMGIEDSVTSPTFLLVQEYDGILPLLHFDVYRVRSSQELLDIGFDDYLKRKGVIAMEWAEIVEDILPKFRLNISLFCQEDHGRKAVLQAFGSRYEKVLENLIAEEKSHD